MRQIIYQSCPSCNGTGDLGKKDCPKCDGSGMKPTGFFFDVKDEPKSKVEVKPEPKVEPKKPEPENPKSKQGEPSTFFYDPKKGEPKAKKAY